MIFYAITSPKLVRLGKNIFRIASFFLFLLILGFSTINLNSQTPFASNPLTESRDLSKLMVETVDQFLMNETDDIYDQIEDAWNFDFTSEEMFDRSISTERDFLKKRLGVVESRITPQMQVLNDDRLKSYKVENNDCVITAVKWSVLDGLAAEGLFLEPKGEKIGQIVFIPDADIVPEVFAGLQNPDEVGYGVARRFAEAGWEVLIPVLVSRSDTFSGVSRLNKFTNQPHREWIYRQAYEVGRHVIGYELQKIFSAIDWFDAKNVTEGRPEKKIGVAGYGEGGLLALYASAIDTRISTSLVSGYFDSRKGMWKEPIYRNVFGLLNKFGDAELAVMSWPRSLIIEHSNAPKVMGPPEVTKGRKGAAPGVIDTPDYESARAEWERAKSILPSGSSNLQWYSQGVSAIKRPFTPKALESFAKDFGNDLQIKSENELNFIDPDTWVDAMQRQERTVREMEYHVQRVLDLCEFTRNKDFWQLLKDDPGNAVQIKEELRKKFGAQIGRLPQPIIPMNPRSRVIEKTDKWTSYDVQLDVWPGVFTWGILLIPNDVKTGEKRPVVVCQHGLEGVPAEVVSTDPNSSGYHYYKGFAARLAEKGYVTFAPFNLYKGEDKFRVLQRKANPLGLTLFSIITGQQERILEWLKAQSFVDPNRIGFYGLSYGGKTAMRVPALVEGYALSICSADFNEWVRKCATTDYNFSYLFTGEYDMPEWDLGHTFNYAEMAGLIAPRPFMVERGHLDGVAIDEWVGFEFEKVRRHYDLIGLSDSVEIEYFTGPHSINGEGTFEFLDRHLKDE